MAWRLIPGRWLDDGGGNDFDMLDSHIINPEHATCETEHMTAKGVAVLMLVASALGPVLTERFAPRMLDNEAHERRIQASRFAGASPVSHSHGPCQTEHINRFGNYVLNPNRTPEPLEQHLQIALAGI
jgi:hypothetical protein